jgi:Collagen triple helix repeat (20 copies)/Photosynthesis system II assembly factor YCF48
MKSSSSVRARPFGLATLALSALLCACGGGGSAAPTVMAPLSVAKIESAPVGANCPLGGAEIDAGLDTNLNGVLDASEITSRQYVCTGDVGPVGAAGATGATGASGAAGTAGVAGAVGVSTLVTLVVEPVGTHCPTGGTKVSSGPDSNRDGVLESNEVTTTAYVCSGAPGMVGAAGANGTNGANGAAGLTGATGANGAAGTAGTNGTNGTSGANGANGANGASGANGANGANGISVLFSIVSEPAGSNCTYGGKRVSSGLDTDGDGALDHGEAITTSYICDGAPGAQGPQGPQGLVGSIGATGPTGPGLTWQAVSVATLASANSGYIASSDSQVVVITLPSSVVAGDTFSVTGAGSGGWSIAQNAGQSIVTENLPGNSLIGSNFQASLSGQPGSAFAVATSADAKHIIAGSINGSITTSNDGGASWQIQLGLPNNTVWYGVATSADGTNLYALAGAGAPGEVYHSTDSGQTWNNVPSLSGRSLFGIACSSDGTKVLVSENGGSLWVSSDSGSTWAASAANSGGNWWQVSVSSDGTRMAAVDIGNAVWLSSDSGANWSATNLAPVYWYSVGMSADGMNIAVGQAFGPIWQTTDGGGNWTQSNSPANLVFSTIAVSASGTRMIAGANTGQTFSSTDSGLTWTQSGSSPSGNWNELSISGDGSFAVGAGNTDSIYTSTILTNTVGAGGYLAGSQYDSIELQYLGSGKFLPVSFELLSGSFTIH